VQVSNKQIMMDNEMETIHRNLIQSILNLLEENAVIRVTQLPSRILCLITKVRHMSFTDLKRIYLLGEKVKALNVHFKTKLIEVHIKKKDQRKKIVIQKSRPKASVLETCSKRVLKEQHVDESDYRMCFEIVKMIFRWTWGKVAAGIRIEQKGGEYVFEIKNLRSVTFNQLSELNKMHDAVSNINLLLYQGVLRFKVTRTNEYIGQENTAKKQRYE
jgi:hypothetical protein